MGQRKVEPWRTQGAPVWRVLYDRTGKHVRHALATELYAWNDGFDGICNGVCYLSESEESSCWRCIMMRSSLGTTGLRYHIGLGLLWCTTYG
jgi:hypothetical protein